MAAMTAKMTTAPVPIGEHVPTADGRVVLYGIDWSGFERLVELRGERSAPRLAYLDGMVEIMSPSRGHEGMKSLIGRLVDAYCLDRGIVLKPFGSWLLKEEPKEAGVEPDECFVFGKALLDRPDLAIEVTWTSGGIEKLEIYRRYGVPEVWFWEDDAISVHILGPDGYTANTRSARLPELDLDLVCRLARCETLNEAIEGLRAAYR
jgi:Uma2 family endonuclease